MCCRARRDCYFEAGRRLLQAGSRQPPRLPSRGGTARGMMAVGDGECAAPGTGAAPSGVCWEGGTTHDPRVGGGCLQPCGGAGRAGGSGRSLARRCPEVRGERRAGCAPLPAPPLPERRSAVRRVRSLRYGPLGSAPRVRWLRLEAVGRGRLEGPYLPVGTERRSSRPPSKF